MVFTTSSSTTTAQTGQSSSSTKWSRKVPQCFAKLSPSSWTYSSSKSATKFLQVGVPEKDQPSLQFLSGESPLEVIKVYQYIRHIFGVKDKPTCANYALNRTGLDNAVKFPEAALAVRLNFYKGDYLDSRPTLEGIESLANDLIKLLSIGGFGLTK